MGKGGKKWGIWRPVKGSFEIRKAGLFQPSPGWVCSLFVIMARELPIHEVARPIMFVCIIVFV